MITVIAGPSFRACARSLVEPTFKGLKYVFKDIIYDYRSCKATWPQYPAPAMPPKFCSTAVVFLRSPTSLETGNYGIRIHFVLTVPWCAYKRSILLTLAIMVSRKRFRLDDGTCSWGFAFLGGLFQTFGYARSCY